MSVKVRKRPHRLVGVTRAVRCGCGKLYVTLNEYEGRPFEVFISFGKAGSCMSVTIGALAISISHGLRAGIPLEEYMRAFSGFRCPRSINMIQGKGEAAYSCIDAVARFFRSYLEERGDIDPLPTVTELEPEPDEPEPERVSAEVIKAEPNAEERDMRGNICTQCGGPVYFAEGCDHCMFCGHSENCGG